MSSKVLRGEFVPAAELAPWLTGAVAVEPEPVAEAPWESELDHDTAVGRLERLQADADVRVEQARREGVEQGEAAAQERFAMEIEPLRRRLGETLAQFAELDKTIRAQTESHMVDLAMAIARRILHREITLDPAAIQDLARAALDHVQGRALYKVRTHPVHERFVHAVLAEAGCEAKVELIADRALRPGDLIFETERADLDASIQTQFEEIRRGLDDARSI